MFRFCFGKLTEILENISSKVFDNDVTAAFVLCNFV